MANVQTQQRRQIAAAAVAHLPGRLSQCIGCQNALIVMLEREGEYPYLDIHMVRCMKAGPSDQFLQSLALSSQESKTARTVQGCYQFVPIDVDGAVD